MVYKNIDMYELLAIAEDKTLICFGAGRYLIDACEGFTDVSLFDRIDFIADNNREKKSVCFNGEEKQVSSIEACLRQAEKEPLILITMADCLDVIEQLENITELNDCVCAFYSSIQSFVEPYSLPLNRAEREPLKIPKTIHYCWFGGNPLRDDFKAYIETWRKYCPDYEIVRWDESNYDYKQNEYMYEAYKKEKWGFVPDFARLDIIYRYGGVYFDTDVELLRNIDDLLCDNAFCGFDKRNTVANGLGFGAVAGFPLIKEQIMIYDKLRFINDDGSLNLTTGPQYQTRILHKLGLKLNNSLQEIQGMKIYPSDVLAPVNLATHAINITPNTYSIHQFSTTWRDDSWQNRRTARYKKLAYLLGHRNEGLYE